MRGDFPDCRRPDLHCCGRHDSSLFTMCPPELVKELAKHIEAQQSKNMSRPDQFTPFPERWLTFRGARYEIWVLSDGRLAIQPPHLPSALLPQPSFMDLGSPVRCFAPPPLFPAVRLVLERPEPDWQELSEMNADVCPSGWVDAEVKHKVEKQFVKHKDFAIVDSAEQADLVFIVESLYWIYSEPGRNIPINYSGLDLRGDYAYPRRQVAMAMVVPADVYRRSPDNAATLLDAAVWQGASVWTWGSRIVPADGALTSRHLEESAVPEILVDQYVRHESWPPSLPPLCPAWARDQPAVFTKTDGIAKLKGYEIVRTLPSGRESVSKRNELVISAESTLVTVPVIARDLHGRYVSGLDASDFRIYENGVEQKIDRLIPEQEPFNLVLMPDISVSMGRGNSDVQKPELQFLSQLRPEDRMGVFSFGNLISINSELTSDRDKLRRAIMNIKPMKPNSPHTTSEGTRMYDAIDLIVTDRLNAVLGRKAIVLFTDGMDSGSRLASAETIQSRIEEADVLVYVVGYDLQVNQMRDALGRAALVSAHSRAVKSLQALCDVSGGRLFSVSAISDLKEAFSMIADELRHYYTLCYYPSNPAKDAAFRRIQVTVERPGITVRAPSGYRPFSKAPAVR